MSSTGAGGGAVPAVGAGTDTFIATGRGAIVGGGAVAFAIRIGIVIRTIDGPVHPAFH